MIKTAAIFPRYAALNSGPVISAMRESCRTAGIQILENSMQADAAIIWSVLWAGRMAQNKQIYDHYCAHNRPVIIVDIGSLIRGVTWKIAINNINGTGWFGHQQSLDPDRPRKLGLLHDNKIASEEILIATQHRHSLQAADINNMEQWVQDQIVKIRRYSDRPIVIRPHPRDPLRLPNLFHGVRVQTPRKIPDTYDNFDWSTDWYAIVNHNSGPGVLAALAGIRPIVHSTSLAWPVAVNMSDIERPYDQDRDQWLIEIAHTEYTLDEIVTGRWLERLGSKL